MYTEEQIKIAKQYEAKAFAAINNDEEFDRIMQEFESVKKSWEKP